MALKNLGLNVAGLRAAFFERFDAQTPFYPKLVTRIESDNDIEHYKWLGNVPQLREWGTGRLARGLNPFSYDVANQKYESTIEVDRDEVSDDKTGQIRMRIQELGERAPGHKDAIIGTLLINGHSTGFNSYDGVSFFNTAHVAGASGNQSNLLTIDISAVLPAEPDTPLAPSVATIKYCYNRALAAMRLFKDDKGEPERIRPGGIVVACHSNLETAYREALLASVINGTTVVPASGVEVVSFPEFTDESQFYVFKTDSVKKPFLFQDREPLEFVALEENSDDGFKKEMYLYGVRARFRITYAEWKYAVKVDMA